MGLDEATTIVEELTTIVEDLVGDALDDMLCMDNAEPAIQGLGHEAVVAIIAAKLKEKVVWN